MKIPDEKLPLLIEALEHLAAYRRVQNRDERPYLELVEALKRKEPEREAAPPAKKKRA